MLFTAKAGSNKKYMTKREIEELEEKTLQEQRLAEEAKRPKKKQKVEPETLEPVQQEDPESVENTKPALRRQDVIRRLRELGEPITLFAETGVLYANSFFVFVCAMGLNLASAQIYTGRNAC